jgi:hypothetical protein
VSITTDLLDGFAGVLVAAGVATYRSDGSTYLPGETAVTFTILPQTPDRVVTLTDYPVLDDPKLPMASIGVQVRVRGIPGSPRDVQALRDSIYTALQGLADQTWGSVHAVQVYRRSSIPNGQDTSLRFEYFENYYVDVDLPVTANRPY